MKKILIASLMLVAALNTAAFAAEIAIEGGAPAIEKVVKPIQEAFEKATGHKLKLLATGPKAALLNLDLGRTTAALGPGFDDWMAFMAKEGAAVKDPSIYTKSIVGEDKIIVITNKENPVSALSKEQLKDIFSGKADNWRAVGGPDMPVMIVVGQLIMPAVNIFYSKVLGADKPAKDQLVVSTAMDVRQSVAANKEAIGIVSYKIADASVKKPEMPEVPITFTLVTKGAPSPEVQQLIDFIKAKK